MLFVGKLQKLRKRRTLRELFKLCTNLGELIEVNYCAKVAHKTANINLQNHSLYARQLTASLHIKNSKYQKR